jgi:predicted dehydrogenase
MSETVKEDDYSLSGKTPDARAIAPDLPYLPRDPEGYRPAIGMIACGGITEAHCKAYTKAGYNVVALCDLIEERARKRQQEFFPKAAITTDYRTLLARPEIEVVDIATHPRERLPLIEAALRADKHVLSQKPFVLDLDQGERLVRLAEERGVKLAVNQNGRWAAHFSYIRQAVKSGLIGDLISVHMGVHWDHSWTKGTPFEKINDLVLYDFAIHWFDILSHLLGDRPIHRVTASRSRAVGQPIHPPLLAQAMVEFEGGQASLVFDAYIKYGSQDRTYVGGTKGTLSSIGPNLTTQTVTLTTDAGAALPCLVGSWFTDGFHGTMAELLCAIAERREPVNSARENLRSLALCFAAIASASDGEPKVPGAVRRLPKGSAPGTEDE